ncbi:MAG: hypothetical protein ACOCTI_05495 [Phycisphaeraceae bacterium]
MSAKRTCLFSSCSRPATHLLYVDDEPPFPLCREHASILAKPEDRLEPMPSEAQRQDSSASQTRPGE